MFGLFKKNKEPSVPPNNLAVKAVEEAKTQSVVKKPIKPIIETFGIAGLNYYSENIEEFAYDNVEYGYSKRELIDEGLTDERIYRTYYDTAKISVEKEPDNEHDKNAIRVAVDGLTIGHIQKRDCRRVAELLASGRIRKVYCNVNGGAYKYVSENEDGKYELETYPESNFTGSVQFFLSPEEEQLQN